MAPAWRVSLDEALFLSHPRHVFICLAWVRNFCLEQPQRFEGSKQGKSEWHCFFEMEEYCPKEGFLFPWWSLCQRDPQTHTATQLSDVLPVQKGSIGVLYQFSCSLWSCSCVYNSLVSLHPSSRCGRAGSQVIWKRSYWSTMWPGGHQQGTVTVFCEEGNSILSRGTLPEDSPD